MLRSINVVETNEMGTDFVFSRITKKWSLSDECKANILSSFQIPQSITSDIETLKENQASNTTAITSLLDTVDTLSDEIANVGATDPAALNTLQAQVRAIYSVGSGGPQQVTPSVSCGSYINGVLAHTSGELLPGVNAAGVIVDGLARLDFAGNPPQAYLTCSNLSTGFNEIFQSTSATRPILMAVTGNDGANVVVIGWATVSEYGSIEVTVDNDPFTVEFLTDRVVLTVNGVEHVSPICPTPLTTPHTKILTLSPVAVNFFTTGSGPSGLLPNETAARIAGDVELAAAIANIELTPGPQGIQGPQGPQGEPADPAALNTLQAQIHAIYTPGSGNAALQNATYENGTLTYTGGTISGYPGMTMTFPLSVAPGGTLTVSENPGGLLYVAVISGSTPPPSMPSLAITVGTNGIGVYDTTHQVAAGTEVPLQWTDHSISAFIDGGWRTLSDAPLVDPHVLFFKVGGGALSPVSIAVDGLVAGAASGGLLPDETAARIAGDAALQQQVNGRLLPVGGSAGQVLAKKSATDFDVEWTEPSVGSGTAGTAGTAIPRSVALLMHFDGDTSDLGERTRWENPDGCSFGPGPFGLSLTKDSNQRGIYCGPSSVFNFGTYDFTLEFWIKLASATKDYGCILGSGMPTFSAGSNYLIVLGEQLSGSERKIDLGGATLGMPMLQSASALPLNEWCHVAITRSNDTIRMFINGDLDASTTSSQEISFSAGGTWIGSFGWDGLISFLDGCIAEMRIDKDICRYDSNFAPPSSPYSF